MTEKDKRREKVARKTARGYEFSVTRTDFSLNKKATDNGRLSFEGYTAIFDTPDSYNDIIKAGAFDQTLKEKGPKLDEKTGETYGDIISLWQHNPDWPFGMPIKFEADSKGLWHKTSISNTSENQDRIEYMSDRVVKGESIGFMTTGFEWAEESADELFPIRYLTGIDLWEISPVTFPAHSDAITELVSRNRELALAVKAADHGSVLETAYRIKGVSPVQVEEAISVLTAFRDSIEEGSAGEEAKGALSYQSLPLGDKGRKWDKAAALGRIKSWSEAGDTPNTKYRQAFCWFDSENSETFSAYKFPIADVLDGTLTAIPNAIFNAAARLDGSNIPDGDKGKIRSHLEKYYKKLDMDPPWAGEGKSSEEYDEYNLSDLDTHETDEEFIRRLERFSDETQYSLEERRDAASSDAAGISVTAASDTTYKPTGAMKTAADRALAWKDDGKAGGYAGRYRKGAPDQQARRPAAEHCKADELILLPSRGR